MKSLYCDKCGYPCIVIWESDFLICPRCTKFVPDKEKTGVDWSTHSDDQLIQDWKVLAEFDPSHVWEVEGEMLTREPFRKMLDMANNHSPTPKMSASTPQWLRRVLWLVSEQYRRSGGQVDYIADAEGSKFLPNRKG